MKYHLTLKRPDSEKCAKAAAFFNRYSLIFHFLIGCLLIFVIELISRRSFISALTFIGHHTFAYFYNALIIFATLSVVYLFRCRAQLRVLISGLWLFLGVINGLILSNRVTPFSYTDLKCISDLFAMQNTNYFTAQEAMVIVSVVVAFCIFLGIFFVKGPKYQGPRHSVATSLSVAALLLIGLPVTTYAAQNTNILASYFSNIAEGYSDYGFVYGFSTSVVGRGMAKPEDYSEEAVAQIGAHVSGEKKQTTVTAENAPNIICVLLESFCDPYEVNFLEMSEDPVPNFHALEKAYSTGYLTVPVVGAGTANTEFEVLTGMSMQFFGTGEYPYKTILKQTDCESAASDLSAIGYGTHVVHNNTATFYSRNNAFSMMGFDSFTSKELMNITEYTPNGGWPTDDVLVKETIKTMTATENQPDFVYTITVEGHGDYPEEKVLQNPAIRVSGAPTESQNNQWEYYVNMMHEVDDFIGDLITAVNGLGEDTIIVFFGDHLPTMGLANEDMKSGDIFKTKYITWNNMGLAREEADLSAYQLLAHITGQAGIHEGTILGYHQVCAGLADYQEGLEMLQYDLLYGKRHAYAGGNPYPATELVMDVEDISVQSLRRDPERGLLFVAGKNFTKNTRVFVNGEKIPTKYYNASLVAVSLEDVADGDSVTVKITGSRGIILRESTNDLVYDDPDAEKHRMPDITSQEGTEGGLPGNTAGEGAEDTVPGGTSQEGMQDMASGNMQKEL